MLANASVPTNTENCLMKPDTENKAGWLPGLIWLCINEFITETSADSEVAASWLIMFCLQILLQAKSRQWVGFTSVVPNNCHPLLEFPGVKLDTNKMLLVLHP